MSGQPPAAVSGVASGGDVHIEVVDSPEDFTGIFDCCAATFGHQINDAIWTGMNPGWDLPDGRVRGAARMADRWRNASRNKEGKPNTVFLKATVPDPDNNSRRRIAGVAIWAQMSVVEGYGTTPQEDIALQKDIEALHPENETERRFVHQMLSSLIRRRLEVIKEKSAASPPALFVLDLCAVDPAFQRRGIASKLVQWGLDEASRRGGLEATTEASSMGRFVYTRHGFQPEGNGEDIVYNVDVEFAERQKPPNVFLRTGAK